MMYVVEKISDCKATLEALRHDGNMKKRVGFVPTMGYLHAGHASLIEKARAQNEVVVVSIFVNPLQFGPHEDLDKYPRDLQSDLALCERLGVDIVFTPTVATMYGQEPTVLTRVHVDRLGEHLCGASRPIHFDGVCTVCAKLFAIVSPNYAYFGKKDAQQWRILRQMVQDLSFDLEIVPCPIIREEDGLALSSRNAYLSPKERHTALILHDTLVSLEQKVLVHREFDASRLIAQAVEQIDRAPGVRLDYLSIVDDRTLSPIDRIEPEKDVLIAIAAYVGTTRLIDNVEIRVER